MPLNTDEGMGLCMQIARELIIYHADWPVAHAPIV